jgi:hypothetical protein
MKMTTKIKNSNVEKTLISEISISLSKFCRFCGLEYNIYDLDEYKRPYSKESKWIKSCWGDHLFHKNQIGSMYRVS